MGWTKCGENTSNSLLLNHCFRTQFLIYFLFEIVYENIVKKCIFTCIFLFVFLYLYKEKDTSSVKQDIKIINIK
jgi:hypothetical protein